MAKYPFPYQFWAFLSANLTGESILPFDFGRRFSYFVSRHELDGMRSDPVFFYRSFSVDWQRAFKQKLLFDAKSITPASKYFIPPTIFCELNCEEITEIVKVIENNLNKNTSFFGQKSKILENYRNDEVYGIYSFGLRRLFYLFNYLNKFKENKTEVKEEIITAFKWCLGQEYNERSDDNHLYRVIYFYIYLLRKEKAIFTDFEHEKLFLEIIKKVLELNLDLTPFARENSILQLIDTFVYIFRENNNEIKKIIKLAVSPVDVLALRDFPNIFSLHVEWSEFLADLQRDDYFDVSDTKNNFFIENVCGFVRGGKISHKEGVDVLVTIFEKIISVIPKASSESRSNFRYKKDYYSLPFQGKELLKSFFNTYTSVYTKALGLGSESDISLIKRFFIDLDMEFYDNVFDSELDTILFLKDINFIDTKPKFIYFYE